MQAGSISRFSLGLTALGMLVASPSLAASDADTEKPGRSVAEIAQELSNPTTAVASITNNLNFTEYDGNLPGADSQRGWSYLLQPGIPFPQENGNNILFRPAFTILAKQPVFGASGWSDQFELGDLGFDLAYGGVNKNNGLLLLGGVVGSVPLATDDAVGTDQWQLGPEVAVGLFKKWGVVGGLFTHQWGLQSDDSKRTNITGGQYFYAFPILDKTWQIAAGPSWSYNHELKGDKLSFPVGFGISKTTMIGTRVWKFSVQYWKYVSKPDAFSPDQVLRFSIAPVISMPWGG